MCVKHRPTLYLEMLKHNNKDCFIENIILQINRTCVFACNIARVLYETTLNE